MLSLNKNISGGLFHQIWRTFKSIHTVLYKTGFLKEAKYLSAFVMCIF